MTRLPGSFVATLALTGEARGRVLTRAGSRIGDWIYVTGERIDPAAYIPLDLVHRGDATVAIVGSGPDSNDQAIHRLFKSSR